jgi:Fe-S cluster assembly protein SufB
MANKTKLEEKDYKYGFHDDTTPNVFKSGKGLTKHLVEEISEMKGEPAWMRANRLKALEIFQAKPMPTWGNNELLSELDFDNIHYYVKPSEKTEKSWDDVPEGVKKTFDKLGIPEAERKFLAGVTAQYESEVVYHSIRKDLEKQGVIFLGMDDAVKQFPDLVKKS